MKLRSFFLSLCLMVTVWLSAQTRTIADFTSVSTSGNVRVELIKSTTNKIEYKMLKGNDEDLITEVKNGKLTIKIKNKWSMSNAKAEVKLYYRTLQGIYASAGSSIQSKEALAATNVDIASSSGSRISLILNASSAKVDASSGSNISLSGSVKGLSQFHSSSGANIEASALSSINADANASSGSNIAIWVTDSIKADASSGGNITYKGEPKSVDSGKSSGGSVSKM